MTKEEMREIVDGLSKDDLKTMRAIINGKLSKRTITPEQQAKLQAGKAKNITD